MSAFCTICEPQADCAIKSTSTSSLIRAGQVRSFTLTEGLTVCSGLG